MDISILYSTYQQYHTICTDTRNITTDCMFFALKGENFDGNAFAKQALESGAAYAVVDDQSVVVNDRYILVDDVLESLQNLAAHHRQQLQIPFIGITGSNGKTTTKELIREVLNMKYAVHATRGNLNNHIGVPLTILEIREDIEIAIIEMGANHVNEIALLCAIARPNHGLITNIGKAHIGEFGGQANIVKGKTELYDSLRADSGLVFAHADDPLLMSKSEGITRVTYGASSHADCQGKISHSDPSLSLILEETEHPIKTQLVGDYNFSNTMAAIAIGRHFGVPEEDMADAIASYAPSNNRSQMVALDGKRIIMDAYNANPDSMKAALGNLASMTASSKAAVLGDMLELGEESLACHREIAKLTSHLGIEVVFVGDEFVKALGASGCFKDTNQATDAVEQLIEKHELILVKGSRGIGLERLFNRSSNMA